MYNRTSEAETDGAYGIDQNLTVTVQADESRRIARNGESLGFVSQSSLPVSYIPHSIEQTEARC